MSFSSCLRLYAMEMSSRVHETRRKIVACNFLVRNLLSEGTKFQKSLGTRCISRLRTTDHFPFSEVPMQVCWKNPRFSREPKVGERTDTVHFPSIFERGIRTYPFTLQLKPYTSSILNFLGTSRVQRKGPPPRRNKVSTPANKPIRIPAIFTIGVKERR